MMQKFMSPDVEKKIFENNIKRRSIYHRVLSYIEDNQLNQLNSGNYSPQTSFKEIFDEFNQIIYQDYLKSEIESFSIKHHLKNKKILNWIINKVLITLLDKQHIFNVSDKLRYRSYFVELVRYNSQIRQRFSERSHQDEGAPDLIQLHKGFALDRKRPNFTLELNQVIIKIREILNNSTNPFIVLLRNNPNYVNDTLQICEEFFRDITSLFNSDFKLSKYQYRSMKALLRATNLRASKDYIITSNTGTGKTEAFFLPVLIYLIATREIKGCKSIIFYPRISLTDDQFLRFCKYLYYINEILRKKQEPLITIGIEHSKADPSKNTYKCPFCETRGQIKYLSFSYYNGSNVAWCRDKKCELGPFGLDFAKFSRQRDWKIFYNPDKCLPNILVCTADSLHLRTLSGLYRHIFGVVWKCNGCQRLLTRNTKCSNRNCKGTSLSPLISDINLNQHYNIDNLIHPPYYLIADEIHLYTEHAGAHIKNIFMRILSIILEKTQVKPIKIGISATIKDPESFGKVIFNTTSIEVIKPYENELLITGRDYNLFLLATAPQLKLIQNPTGKISQRGLSTLSSMIQTTFCCYHNLKDVNQKKRIITFMDSISTIAKFSRYLYHADSGNQLYLLRYPAAKFNYNHINSFPIKTPNINCPYKNIIGKTPIFNCGDIPPNQNIFPCNTYDCGECWFLLSLEEPILIQAFSSTAGISKPFAHENNRTIKKLIKMYPDKNNIEEWDMRISTNALEVGFDHPELIGVFQYLAPQSPIQFVQRKGRGGRGADDMPISMITFSTNPLDQFYFKNSHLLMYPEESPLYIADSKFIQDQHIVSSIFDFIALKQNDEAIPRKIYNDLNTELLYDVLTLNKKEITNWIHNVYSNKSLSYISSIIDEMISFTKILNIKCTIRNQKAKKAFWYLISNKNWTKNPSTGVIEPKLKINWSSINSSLHFIYLRNLWRQVKYYWQNQEFIVFQIPSLLSPTFLQSNELKIPYTFVSMMSGGELAVMLPNERIEESIDFILSLFTPGSIKSRWKYYPYGTNLDCLKNNNIFLNNLESNLGENVDFNRDFIPRDLLLIPSLNINAIEVKKPQFIKLLQYKHTDSFYFETKTKKISQNKKGMLLKKEPQGNPKFFRSIIKLPEEFKKYTIDFKKFSISLFKEIEIQKVFFGTDLIIYLADLICQIPYIYTKDDSSSFSGDQLIGFNHTTHALKIDIVDNLFNSFYDFIISKKPENVWKELKFNYFFTKLAQLLVNEEGNPYIIKPMSNCFKALETYMLVKYDSNLINFFNNQYHKRFVEIFIGDNEERTLTPLLGIILAQKIEAFLIRHENEIKPLLDSFNNDFKGDLNFQNFIRDSFFHTLKHGFIRAFQNFCYLGLKGIRGMFPSLFRYPNVNKTLINSSILLFDELEGGSGICETIFSEIKKKLSEFHNSFLNLKQCEIERQEITLIQLLTQPLQIQKKIIFYLQNNMINELTILINSFGFSVNLKDVEASVIIFKKIYFVDEYLFYREVALLYQELSTIIKRKPVISDLLIFMDYKKPLKNHKANKLYKDYLSKSSKNLSPIIGKLSEILPLCINSCPLCFEIENCEHIFPLKIISELTIFKQFFDFFQLF